MRWVAFLGGINVGGHRVKMDALRDEFSALGYADVSTFIASGNVVFDAPGRGRALEQAIEARLEEQLGYAVPTFLRPAKSIADIAAYEPFGPTAERDSLHVLFLDAAPGAAAVRATEALSNHQDRFEVRGTELYWGIHGNLMDSSVKSSVLAKAHGQRATARNVKSLRKLAATL
ncbi:MAG TPA: DUF1697 domain-containing protein [Acidimicrobiia bacterium]|nr:DUF1697 domain-containing protein [Acidimicrobiia bacterium]